MGFEIEGEKRTVNWDFSSPDGEPLLSCSGNA